jgi:hypothetical protein
MARAMHEWAKDGPERTMSGGLSVGWGAIIAPPGRQESEVSSSEAG